MITKKGTYLLEYNVKMGDPETQSVLYLMKSDLLEVIEAAMNEDLANVEIKWNKGACVNVVLASKRYPGKFVKWYEINIRDEVRDKVFLVGAEAEGFFLLLEVTSVDKPHLEAPPGEIGFDRYKC